MGRLRGSKEMASCRNNGHTRGSLVGKTSRELAGVAKHDGGQIHGQEKKENIPEDSTTSSTIEDFCAGSSMFSWRSLA